MTAILRLVATRAPAAMLLRQAFLLLVGAGSVSLDARLRGAKSDA
jgi:hypothetical protein